MPRIRHNGIRPTIPSEEHILFSFKYLIETKRFSYADKGTEYFCKLVGRLKTLSRHTPLQVKANRSSSWKCHSIDWDDRRVREDSFGLPRQLEQDLVDEPYQISVSGNKHGRIHGFFVHSIFYVRWLDPDHNLYGHPG